MAAQLEVTGLAAGYGDAVIVHDMSLAVAAGERLLILGRNGVGKTTLLACLAGLAKRVSGSISIDGRDVSTRGAAARALLGLGYVPQSRDVFRSLTVEENLVAGLKDRPRSALAEAYVLFPRLAERRRHRGGQLSGGEQQMLSTARAILGQPSVLLLDEPLEGLAPVICEEFMTALDRLAAAGAMSVLLVEQRLEFALAFAERVLIMERGHCAWTGSAAALRADTATVERLLGVALAKAV